VTKKLQRKYQVFTNPYESVKSDLRYWGNYIKSKIYLDSTPKSTLGPISDFGISVPSGWAEEIYSDPVLRQIYCVWIFMPNLSRLVILRHFGIDGRIEFKARQLGLSTNEYRRHLADGFDFYLQHKNTDFLAYFE